MAEQNSSTSPTTTTASATTTSTTPKIEFIEGKVVVDGKKFVPEADIMALKEAHTKQLNEAQAIHSAAIDTAKLQVSEQQKLVAQANAKVTELQQAAQGGANNSESLAKAEAKAASLQKELEVLKGQSLDMRKQSLQNLGLTAEQLKDKSPEQLSALEEAMQAINASGNRGRYDKGGSSGDARPITPVERAAKILASTPIRGVRNEPVK
jgi:hypothetical protein